MTIAALLLVLLAEGPAPAVSSPGLIPFGTKSEAASAAAREALQILVRRPGDRAATRAAAQRAVDADPEFALAHQLLSVAFRLARETEPADVQAARARELAARAPDGERRLIDAWQLHGKPDEAYAAWKTLAADFPGEALAHMAFGQIALSRATRAEAPVRSSLKDAQEALAAALRLEPESPMVLRTLVDSFLQADDFAAARRTFEQAGADRFTTDIAMTHLLEGNPAEARALLRQHVEKKGSELGVAGWNFVAHLALEAGDAETALGWYEKGFAAVKSDDRSDRDRQVWTGRYHHGRGRCLARLGKHRDAWAEVEIVKKMIDEGGEEGKPFLPAWHFLAGYVKLEAGENEAAAEHLKEAGPQHDPHRTLLLAQATDRLGDKAAARQHYEQVVRRKRLSIDGAAAFAPAKARLAALAEEPAAAVVR